MAEWQPGPEVEGLHILALSGATSSSKPSAPSPSSWQRGQGAWRSGVLNCILESPQRREATAGDGTTAQQKSPQCTGARRFITTSWRCPPAPRRPRSRQPTTNSPSSTTLTRTRAARQPHSAFLKSAKLTQSWVTSLWGGSTTAASWASQTFKAQADRPQRRPQAGHRVLRSSSSSSINAENGASPSLAKRSSLILTPFIRVTTGSSSKEKGRWETGSGACRSSRREWKNGRARDCWRWVWSCSRPWPASLLSVSFGPERNSCANLTRSSTSEWFLLMLHCFWMLLFFFFFAVFCWVQIFLYSIHCRFISC